jgi:hypothetical protein
MSWSNLSVSGKNLGSINIRNYCPRCLWYMIHIRFHPPFTFSGRLFNDAEACEKAVLGYYLDKDGCLPKPFGPIQDCCARAECPRHWSKFGYTHCSGVDIYGIPDEVLRRADETLAIVDHKTAHAKGEDDPFLGQYIAQVNAYANIAEVGLGLGRVTMGALLYWEVQVGAVESDPADHYQNGRLWMPLDVKPLEVKIDYKLLDHLTKEFKDIKDAAAPPDGLKHCKDCQKLDLLFAIDQNLQVLDRASLMRYQDSDRIRKAIKNRVFNRENYLRDLLAEFEEKGGEIFASDGMVASWDFDSDPE